MLLQAIIAIMAIWRSSMTTTRLSVAEAKNRFSELMGRAAYGKERFIIERRGKPVGAIVSTEDLARLEQDPSPRMGLIALAGAFGDVDDFEQIMEEVVKQRSSALDREVDLE
jgi:prevent-host-death family protein